MKFFLFLLVIGIFNLIKACFFEIGVNDWLFELLNVCRGYHIREFRYTIRQMHRDVERNEQDVGA